MALQSPKQFTLFEEVTTVSAAGSVIVMTVNLEQPLKSVTVQVCVPAHKPPAVFVIDPLGAQEYVYGKTPPLGVTVAEPSHAPLQLAFVPAEESVRSAGSVIVTVAVAWQEFASIMVTVCVPGQRSVGFWIVCPPGAQAYVAGGTPIMVVDALPSQAPKQLTLLLPLITTEHWLYATGDANSRAENK